MCKFSVWCWQSDKDKGNISKLIEAIKQSKGGTKIGVYARDKFSSDLIDAWGKAVKENSFEPVRLDLRTPMAVLLMFM